MYNRRTYIAVAINISVIILEILSLVMTAAKSGLSMLLFYTVDSNLLAMAGCIAFLIYAIRLIRGTAASVPPAVKLLKYMSVCCLSITFIVVVCFLAPMNGLSGYVMMMLKNEFLFHHLLCPLLCIVSFILFERGYEIPPKHMLPSLIPTAAYAIPLITLNITDKVHGPYPFLMVHDQPVSASIAWVAAIFGLALLIAWIIRKAKNHAEGKAV